MRTKIILILSVAVLVVSAGIMVFNNQSSSVSGQSQPPGYDENFALSQLNVKARAVNEGGNSTAVNNMVDEIFTTFQTVLASDVKSRIANSEILYRSNQRSGVTETDVVEAINGLQIYFNTPEFSKTDLFEVRKARLSLQNLAPQFVAHGRPSEANFTNNVNATIVPDMSPAEAVFVTMTIMYQKRSNPNYQITIAERNANWSESHGLKGMEGVEADPERANQINEAIRVKLNSLTTLELLAIPHSALNILGIE